MKKIAIIIVVICLGVVGYQYFFSKAPTRSPLASVLKNDSSPTPTKIVRQKKSDSIFIPYWSFSTEDIDAADFDNIIYFGIAANTQGIDTNEIGYKKLVQFTNLVPEKETFLTVRMIDSAVNSKVLDDKNAQRKIIKESIALAKQHGFSGIVFDFEINALAFPSVVSNITDFYKTFYTESKKQNLTFAVTLYGDTFYRARPYDVAEISQYADTVLVMTYDFHKSRGNPGPNFPLSGKNIYGYDIASMLNDFSTQVPKEKLVIVFGLFGYDWEVNGRDEAVKNGVPLSFLEIKQQFIDTCTGKNCQVTKDSISSETKITYTDDQGNPHIVWFETQDSMEKKKTFLRSQGINATSIWAYSYY